MNCKWCNNELSNSQVYDFLRGKTKGNSCSKSCALKLKHYKNKQDEIDKNTKDCTVCGTSFNRKNIQKYKVCSTKCSSVLSSERMTEDNPMKKTEVRKKVSKTLKKIKHKPIIQGGNGRGATVSQLSLYNELSKIDDSFCMEYIELTKGYKKEFNTPYHYKIDIASAIHKIAIEVDGVSHKSLKVKECDKRKKTVLTLKGWKVLRLSNSQIENELTNCVKMVTSMI